MKQRGARIWNGPKCYIRVVTPLGRAGFSLHGVELLETLGHCWRNRGIVGRETGLISNPVAHEFTVQSKAARSFLLFTGGQNGGTEIR